MRRPRLEIGSYQRKAALSLKADRLVGSQHGIAIKGAAGVPAAIARRRSHRRARRPGRSAAHRVAAAPGQGIVPASLGDDTTPGEDLTPLREPTRTSLFFGCAQE